MSHLIGAMRDGDWSTPVPGIYGALIVAKASPEASSELKAFVSGLQPERMNRGIQFLLKQEGLM
jgi:hypothetical protein